jgi:hypothetical protein
MCPRYEKCAQGIQLLPKGMKCFLRYETRVFLKNSGFSYLYGSISYLFGYENIGYFSLMGTTTARFTSPHRSSPLATSWKHTQGHCCRRTTCTTFDALWTASSRWAPFAVVPSPCDATHLLLHTSFLHTHSP